MKRDWAVRMIGGSCVAVAVLSGCDQGTAASSAPAGATSQTSAAAEPSDPKAVYLAEMHAAVDGDAARLFQFVHDPTPDQRTAFEGMVKAMSALNRTRHAVDARWGPNPPHEKSWASALFTQLAMPGNGISAAEHTTAKIDGDTATLTDEQGQFMAAMKRVSGKWKQVPTADETLQLIAQGATFDKVSRVADQIVPEIQQGKYDSFEAMSFAWTEKMVNLGGPQ